ncbi:MAG: 50S ribosomal protein L29 [Firmicutes bacterium]|nr:50S ribosomal protein L29 [Bacillota bacterium]
MKITNFFELTNEELNIKLSELKAELFDLRFKHATNQLSNPLVLNQKKKDIARAKTVLKQRELGLSKEPARASGSAKKAKKAKA